MNILYDLNLVLVVGYKVNSKKGMKMMKFKRNLTITLACILSESLISFIPMLLIMFFVLMPEKSNEFIPGVLLGIPMIIVIINIFLYLLGLIFKIFQKLIITINQDHMIIENKNSIKTIYYKDIKGITYDLGTLPSRTSSQDSELVIFGENYSTLVSIKNPSLLMTHLIKRKCKHIKVSYYHSKRLLYMVLISIGVTGLLLVLRFFGII